MGKEKDYFLENLAMLFGASVNIIESLDALLKEARSRKMRSVIARVKDDIDAGFPLSKALQHVSIFPDHVISLVKIGEESGRLSENLKIIAIEREKDREFKSKLRSAMAYPVVVLTLTVTVGLGVAYFILPKLADTFADLKIGLPAITKILILAGNYLETHGIIIIPVAIIGVILFFYLIFFFKYTKFIGERLMFLLPGTRGLIMQIEVARFGHILGNLLEAGLPIIAALQSLEEATTFYPYKRFYKHLKESIEIGDSFEKSFRNYRGLGYIFPATVVQLILAAEKSGVLSQTFIEIGEKYGAKTDITIKNITTIIEPILLVIVWLGVLAVAIAIILPIYSLIGELNP